MSETFKFELVSPERLLISRDVISVLVPGDEGDFMILPNHAPVMSTLRPGMMAIVSDDGEERFFVKGGFAEAGPSSLTVLAEYALEADELKGERLADEREACEREMEKASTDLAIKHANDFSSCLDEF